MLKLSKSDITLGQTAEDKFKAIQNIAGDLTVKGLVESGYVEGMLNLANFVQLLIPTKVLKFMFKSFS